MYIIFGIKNCDSIKKTMVWLGEKGVKYIFHDYKKSGISEEKLKQWAKQVGWDKLVNKQGNTWRMLDEKTKASVMDSDSAIKLMMEKNSVIKRPLIEEDEEIVAVGLQEVMDLI